MFLKPTIFKKLIKEAWAGGGLTVGCNGKTLFVEGGYWVINMKMRYVPNNLKASLVELVGELPAAGEVFESHKGEENQQVMEFTKEWDLEDNLPEDSRAGWPTVITMNTNKNSSYPSRLVQTIDRRITLISDIFIDLVDNKYIDEDGGEDYNIEMMVSEKGVYWTNNMCAVMACKRYINNISPSPRDKKNKLVINALENLDLE